jgi:hypothetical protein
MKFQSKRYRVINILKKTKAKGFSNIEYGDEVWFSIDLKNTIGASSGIYALYVKTYHYGARGEASEIYNSWENSWENSQNDFLRFINNFELEEVIYYD